MIYGGYFEVSTKLERISEIDKELNKELIWNDRNYYNKIIIERTNLKKSTDDIINLKNQIINNIDILKDLKDNEDLEIYNLIQEESSKIIVELNKLEITTLLNGKYDSSNCIFEIHSGAGGTEACDWASMLFRMYQRYFDNKGYKTILLDLQEGEEAGIKSVSLLISGLNVYGYLKCEKGVHRLVRLSPFDANHKRHTSFAAVLVTPVIEETSDIEINDSDLKIDVYHSSGAGGQSVNTTDSAVRITHLPTGIVVTCQNERSQQQNREQAMEILKSKLKMIEMEKREEELNNLNGNNKHIEFGSQIRSYVMHPYSMVKDHRTNVETSNVYKVLDGDIDMFIESYLRNNYGGSK